MNVFVAGATGVLGRNTIPRLLERGHKVRALTRRPDQEKFLKQAGVDTRLGDLFDLENLIAAAQGCEAVLHLATAIPKGENQDWSRNDRVRREGTQNLLEAARVSGIERYIQQSITLLYGHRGTQIVDESAPLQVTPITQSAADMEQLVRTSGLEWNILRGGIFYGSGTGREDGWRQSALEDRLIVPGDGEDIVSLTHVVDMARAVIVALERPRPGEIYNITDDEPVRYTDLFDYISAQVGKEPVQNGAPRFLPSLGCSNKKAKDELGWQPAYPSYRSGLANE